MTVTVTAVKYVVADSDEIVALQYESDGDVRYVIVKGGKDTIRYPGNDYSGAPVWYRAPTNENDEFPRQHHELSYVQFCVSDA